MGDHHRCDLARGIEGDETAPPFERCRDRHGGGLEATRSRKDQTVGGAEGPVETEQGRPAAGAPALLVIGAETPRRDDILVDAVGLTHHDTAFFRKQFRRLAKLHPFAFSMDGALPYDLPRRRERERAVSPNGNTQGEDTRDGRDERARRDRGVDELGEARSGWQGVGKRQQARRLAANRDRNHRQ